MATCVELRTSQRVVTKAFDGTAAFRAQLALRVQSRDCGRNIAMVAGLLEYGYPQAEVTSITGMPQKVVANVARDLQLESHRAGRRPSDMGKIFANPTRHLRMSIFLKMIDELVPNLRQGGVVTGAILLSASRHTDAVCGGIGDDEMGVRYCVPAIHRLSTGDLFLRTCGTCHVRTLRSRETLKVNGSVMTGGECPYCLYTTGLVAKARKKIQETRGQMMAPAMSAAPAFDDVQFGPAQTSETNESALRALLA